MIALVALGVALWALLDDTGDSDRQDGSRVRVERLADRVDRLESQLGEAASGGGVAEWPSLGIPMRNGAHGA